MFMGRKWKHKLPATQDILIQFPQEEEFEKCGRMKRRIQKEGTIGRGDGGRQGTMV